MTADLPNDAEYQAVCAHLKSLKWRSMPTKAEVRAMRDALTSKPSAQAVVPAAGDAGRDLERMKDHVRWLLPLAKGYAARGNHSPEADGTNDQIIEDAEAAIRERTCWVVWQAARTTPYCPLCGDTPGAESEVVKDAARYRHMRNNAAPRDRNGPGLYWYLPRLGNGDWAEQLDAAIDAALSGASGTAKGEGQ